MMSTPKPQEPKLPYASRVASFVGENSSERQGMDARTATQIRTASMIGTSRSNTGKPSTLGGVI
jgi:hypothetical protein